LGKLHLQTSVPAFRALGEDVQDQLSPVNDLKIAHSGNGRRLRRAQVVIENEHRRVEIAGAQDDVVQLSFADDKPRIEAIARLQHAVHDLDAGRARKLCELVEAVGSIAIATVYTNQDRATVFGNNVTKMCALSELCFEVFHQVAYIHVELMNRRRADNSVG
jgi:hypothetical protein